jgi:hypothetical protein
MQPPASNPGSDDPSGGIAKDNGGVSASAYIGSPVQSEEKGIVQSTVDTVKNYLSGLSLGGGSTAARDAEGQARDAEERDQQQESSTSSSGGVVAGATAAASAATAAVVGSSEEDKKEEETEPQESTVSSVDASAERSDTAAKDETMADSAQKDDTSKSDEQTEPKQSSVKGTGAKENRDAIPTAGGERLGEKHWGESKNIPDVPPKEPSEKVSSSEGQPDCELRS